MIEKTWLAVMALAAAYLLVTLIPGVAPEVSARTADKTVGRGRPPNNART